MTHNDEQIDLLMRRFAQTASGAPGAQDHLDGDEMNAFAEGALPPPARARYVSHLANCDECRQQVTQLAIASGAVARAEQSVTNNREHGGLWAALTSVFALPVLRYAAFAAIVVVVAGVGFIALRHRSERGSLVAVTEPSLTERPAAVNSAADTNGGLNDKTDSTRANAASPPAANSASPLTTLSNPQAKSGGDRLAESATPPPVMSKEETKVTEGSEKKAEQVPVTQSQNYQVQPSYAPAPPGEAQQNVSRGQTQSGGVAAGGGFKTQPAQSADKAAPAARESVTVAKDAELASNQPVTKSRRDADEKLKSGPSRNVDNTTANNRVENEARARAEAPKGANETVRVDDAPQPRSVGGHKFRRQGNSWVDQKFKSSMPLRNVSRGSEDYAALDSGLRSIAQQISGEVIIVWKGKAYLIK